MRIIVDLDVCAAHGDCVVAAPDLFDLGDDDDVVTVLIEEPGEEHRAAAARAVQDCPVSAIRLEE